jgi:hypothetical protein
MRRRSAMDRRRRQTREAGTARGHIGAWARTLGAAFGRWAPPQRVRRILPTLVLLLGIGALFGVRPAAAGAVPSGLPARVEGPPVVARWVDNTGDLKRNVQATAYTLWMRGDQAHAPGTFIFTVTGGTSETVQEIQISGGASLQPSSGGTLTQNTCDVGQAAINSTPVAHGVTGLASRTNLTVEPVVYQLRSRVDQNGLVAYAVIGILGVNTADTTLCFASKGAFTVFQMVSGCDPVSDTCADVVNDPATGIVHSVNSYADAVKSGDWGTVYKMTSQLVTSQYSAADFATLIQGEYSSVGRITAVSHISTPVDVRFDAGGQAYFKVSQTITFDKNGQTSTTTVTSYYLYEAGGWKFWFSCDATARC